ncbi:MAG: EAL domain-containing protein, partial [Cyanobacteria bacterium P01_H01_bin.121]
YERQLHYALPQQQLQLAYQPIVRLSDSKVTELEVLLRWQHPVFGAIAPDQFIPLAEKTGLIVPIGLWILETACKQLAHWRLSEPQLFDQVKLSINLSTVQLNQPRLPEQVSQILVATGLKAADLSLEVTESGVMEDSELAHQSLQSLRQQGIQIYIDDFGTGYSCLSRLHELPIDVIKVDRSFVNRMHTLDGAQVIHLITSLAQSLGARVVAEGIETVEQQHQLQRMGCDYGQGYLFQRPLSAERLSLSLAA